MTSFWIELSNTGLGWVCLAAWRSLPLFLIVGIFSLALRKRMPAGFHCLLWMLVVARLCLPFSLDTPYSLSSGLKHASAGLFPAPDASEEVEFQTFTFKDGDSTVTLPIHPQAVSIPQDPNAPHGMKRVELEQINEAVNARIARQPSWLDENADSLVVFLSAIWLIGFVFILGRGVIRYARFARHLRRQTDVDERWVIDQILRACDATGVGRRPRIKEVESLQAPAVFGFWRPILCLPVGWRQQLSPEQLDWVFKHELAHVQRRDALLLALAGIAKSLHWFHPLPWITLKKLQTKVEQAADEIATRGLNRSQIQQYGGLLLQYASANPNPRHSAVVGLLAMSSTVALRGRIDSLHDHRVRHPWLLRFMFLPVYMFIALAGLTDATVAEPEPVIQPNRPWVVLGDEHPLSAPPHPLNFQTDEDQKEHQFDVRRVIAKAKQIQPEVDAHSFILHYFASPDPEKSHIKDGVLHTITSPRRAHFIQELLDAFCDSGAWQIALEFRVIQSDTQRIGHFDWLASAKDVRCRRLGLPPDLSDLKAWDTAFSQAPTPQPFGFSSMDISKTFTLPLRATKVTEEELGQFVRLCNRDQRTSMVMAPKVTLFNGQSASVQDIVQRPFVTDVVEGQGEWSGALQPKISVFEQGWTIQIRPVVQANGSIDIRCIFTESQIGDVQLANLPVVVEDDPEGQVTVQVPSVQSHSIAVSGNLFENEVLLVYSPQPYSSVETNQQEQPQGKIYSIRPVLLEDNGFLDSFVPSSENLTAEEKDPTSASKEGESSSFWHASRHQETES